MSKSERVDTTTTAWRDAKLQIRPAICVWHPEGNKEKFFCIDCNQAFCTLCTLADDMCAIHKSHLTIRMNEWLGERRKRIKQLQTQLEEYSTKHNKATKEADKRVDEKNRQLQALFETIDQFTDTLHQEIDALQVRAKRLVQKNADQIWEKSSAASLHKAADETLSKIRQVRTILEYEIRRAELDELAMAESSNEMDALGNQIDAFLKTQIRLPDASDFNLVDLRTQLQTLITELHHEVSRSKETFIRGLDNTERVRLVEKQTIDLQSLVLSTDKNNLPKVNGVALEENTDIIYFTDENNPSKIKSLNLKTNQVGEVHNKYLKKCLMCTQYEYSILEMSTGPKFPTRPANVFVRPGINESIYCKICTMV